MKRTLILLLCGLLLLGACTASAANSQDVFARNHALQWTLTLSPDTEVLLPLLQGDTPLFEEFQRALQRSDNPEGASEAIKTLADGVADLRLSGSFAPWALSLSLGTEQAVLASASLWADAKTGGNGIATDLLDCLFYLPQDRAKPALEQASSLLNLDISGLISPYLILLREEANNLLNDKEAELGNYLIGELGEFNMMVSQVITTHDAARVLKTLLDAFEKDFALQTAITQVMYTSSVMKGEPPEPKSAIAETSRELKEALAQILSQDEADLLELSAYGRAGLDSLCYVIDTSRVQKDMPFRLAVLPGKKGGVILTAGEGSKLEGVGTPQGVEWEKFRLQTVGDSGQPIQESTHIALQYASSEGKPLALSLWAYSAGMPLVGVAAEHKAQQAESYQSETTAQLSVFGKEPVLSLALTLQETDTLPTLPETTNWPVYSLMDDDLESKVDTSNLSTLLLRRFSLAFPDTAEKLIKAAQLLGN